MIFQTVSAHFILKRVREDVKWDTATENVSFGFDGRAMGDFGAADPGRKNWARRAAEGKQHAGGRQHDPLPQSYWLPMAYVAPRSAAQEYRLRLLFPVAR